MNEAERARKKEILRKIVETLPPEERAAITERKIDWILDAIGTVERESSLMQNVRMAPWPEVPISIFAERGGEHED